MNLVQLTLCLFPPLSSHSMYLSRYRSKDPKSLSLTVEEFRALKRTNPPMLGTLMRWE